jgi:hypothetical protein
MEAYRADRADRAGGEYKVSEAVKAVRTCQNSLGQNGTRLGLRLLHVGPNGDGFGGQAFMEHYTDMGDGSCEVSMLLVMKSAESLNVEISIRGFGYRKEVRVVRMWSDMYRDHREYIST